MFWCLKETSPRDISFTHQKHMFDRKKNCCLSFLVGYILLCLIPYNSNFQYFEIKPLVPRTSNLRDSTIHVSLTPLSSLLALRNSDDEYVISNITAWTGPFTFTGGVLGFENLVYSVFEFVHILIDSAKFRSTVKKSVDQVLYYVILYMQITEDQVGMTDTKIRQLSSRKEVN